MKRMNVVLCMLLFSFTFGAIIVLGQASEVYLINSPVKKMYLVDVSQCKEREIGTPGAAFQDIAITADNRLWGITWEAGGGGLYEVDTGTGAANLVAFLDGVTGNNLVALNDSVLFFAFGLNLYSVKTTSGEVKYLDSVGYASYGDIAWYNNDLYMTSDSFLVKIVFNESFDKILASYAINSPRQPIPLSAGMATVELSSGETALLIFPINVDDSTTIYKMNTYNASFEEICSNILPGGSAGAASISKYPEVKPASQKRISKSGTITQIYPNPTRDKIYIKFENIKNNLPSSIKIRIVDFTGRYVGCQTLSNKEEGFEIDMSALKSGIYRIEVVSGDEYVGSYKIIKL